MQIIRQSLLSFTGKSVKGLLRAGVLLFALSLPFMKVHAIVEKEAVYAGDTLLWRCQLLGESGTYYDGPSYTMQFSVLAAPTSENVALAICKGDTLLWNCQRLYAGGLYKDTAWYKGFPTMAKTYYQLDLRVIEAVDQPVENQTICTGDTLLWRCQKLYEAGTYHDTLKSLVCPTCDSLYYTLNLAMSTPTLMPEEDIEMILGDTLLWRCMVIACDAEGTTKYKDTVYAGSCASEVYTLNLTVKAFEPEEVVEDVLLCASDTLLWRCQLLAESGTYYDTLKSYVYTAYDSVHYTLNLTVSKDSVAPIEVKYIAPGESYDWIDGNTYSAAGEHEYQTHYTNGCDSILYRLQVVLYDSTSLTSCDGEVVLWRCYEANETKIYRDTVREISIFTGEEYDKELYLLNFTFHGEPVDSVKDEIATAIPYLWRGQSLEESGTYRDTVYTVPGDNSSCIDSLFTLNLKVELAKDSLEEVTLCNGDTLLWRCQQVYATGTYTDTLFYDPSGNDSIRFTLNLTVSKDSVAPVEVKYIAPGESYDWIDGNTYSAAGEHEYQTHYTNGCDSILYRLQVVLYDSTSLTSCDGEVVLWRCYEANETKIYRDTVREISIFTGEEYDKELYLLNFTFHGEPVDSVKDEIATAIPYLWRGQSLEESGTYRDTVYTVPGDNSSCIDSLFTLNLKVELAKDSLEEVTLCNGDTLLWRCQQVYATGTYTDTLFYDPSGNDSIRFTLNLTVSKDSVAPVEVKYIVPGESYDWIDGNTYSAAGEHEYQTYYTTGCDSILYRLQVVLYDSTALKSCDGDTVLWRCHLASETKIYSDTVREASIFEDGDYIKELYILNFTFHQAPYDSIKADTISSDALPYLWRTRELTETGEYKDTVYVDNDPTNCVDSLFTLNLVVQQITDSLVYDTLCVGDTLLWRCQLVYETGKYYDTLYYENSGNDSIRFTLDLTIQKDSITPLQEVILCNNDSLYWFDGTWIKESGAYEYQSYYAPTLYQQSLGMDDGCDSVLHRLVVIARHVRDTLITDTICNSDAENYTWRGLNLDIPSSDLETKTYSFFDTVRYIGSTDCDSIRFKLDLTVQRATYMPATDTTVCKDDVINFRWKPYNTEFGGFTVTTTKYDTARYSITGCDSVIYQLNLRVLAPLADTIVTDTTICYSDVMEWFGQTYDAAGRYEHTIYYTGTECDSLYCRLQLHYYAEPDTVNDAITICEGAQPYLWHGQNITSNGVYWDSTYYDGTQCINRYFKLEVDMLSPTTVDTTAMFCQGGSFTWDRTGETLSETGTYTHKIPYKVLDGCDSVIIRLHLSEVVPVEQPAETQYICDGESYTWHGKTFNTTGVYLDTLVSTVTGCDSLYYTLNLERQPAMSTMSETLYICNGEPVVWDFNQQTYTHAGIYNHTIPSIHGCDSIAGELHVIERTTEVNAPQDESIYATQAFTWIDGKDYTEAGTYEYIIPFADGNCDSLIYTLNLTVLDIEHTVVEVTEIVCPGTTYEEHGKQHIINEHTQWSDTTRTDQGGVLTDVITNYDIDVYEFSMPSGFMGFVVASCGLPVNVDSALTLLQEHIDSYDNYAPDASITWSYREDNGSWKTLDGQTALSGQTEVVTVRCQISSECGAKMQEQSYEVGKRATPETFTEYDLLPVIRKYGGTMLMVDIDAVCAKFGWQNGVEVKPEDVQWYMRVGKTDNLSYPDPADPKDIATNKWGYYYVPNTDDDYYALIKGKLEVEEEDCGVWARTLVVEGTSPIQLQPNVSQGNGTVTISGITQGYVTISDMYGNVVMNRTAVSGSFKAPASAGTYFVQIEDGVSIAHRTLIVY